MDEPDHIGRFETVKLLGRGGMGVVYLARDPVIDRPVAVKLLGEGFDAAARERFAREARAAGRLDHENIVTIFDVGEHHGRPFIAMEFVPGQTLGAIMRRSPRLPQVELLGLIEDACRGLAFAHRSGVVHLDVKPENLIRREDGRLKILDFGIARVIAADETHTRHVLGTLRYMSPEQLTGAPVDHRSDVFGLGCVIFEVMAGQPAFGDTWPEVLARLNGGSTPRLSDLVPAVHPGLERLAARAMAADPAERYDDLETLRQELAIARREIESAPALPPPATTVSVRVPAVAHVPSPSPAAMPAARAPRSTARWFGAAVAAGVVVALSVLLWPPGSASPPDSGPGPAIPASATAPLDAPSAATADASRPSAEAAADGSAPGAFTSAVRQALAKRDYAATLALLRSGEADVSAGVLVELTELARTAAGDARRAADQRGVSIPASADYRAAVTAQAQARRLAASGQPIEALSALWDATALFQRATPAAATEGNVIAQRPPPPATPAPAPAQPANAISPTPVAREAESGTVPMLPPPAGAAPGELVRPPPSSAPVSDPSLAGAPSAGALPAAPPPASDAPVRRAPTAEEAVRATLAAYEAAYDQRDVEALRRVFPGLPSPQAQALTQAFADALSYRLELRVLGLNVGEGTATAACEVTHALVPKVGSASRNTQSSTFHLAQADGRWVIARLESSARR